MTIPLPEGAWRVRADRVSVDRRLRGRRILDGRTLVRLGCGCGVLAREPTLVVLGQRGPRAKREQWRSAVTWLACLLLLAGAAVVGTILTVSPAAGWALLVPLLPAMALAGATLRGAEKSLTGETATSLAASGAAVPIVLAGGAPPVTAAAVAIPFALLFVSSTLAVRAGILGVRGGGNPRAASTTRLLALWSCVAPAAGWRSLHWLAICRGGSSPPRHPDWSRRQSSRCGAPHLPVFVHSDGRWSPSPRSRPSLSWPRTDRGHG